MATPVKAGTSFLFTRSRLSPSSKVLSPNKTVVNKLLSSPPQKVNDNEASKSTLLKVPVPNNFYPQEDFILDTPHKKTLLNHGLNKHDLMYLIGRGSFGSVIRGKYKGKEVAIKLIKIEDFDNLNEINALHFSHLNIIGTVDVIISDKYSLIIMEYIRNSINLQKVIDDANYNLDKNVIIRYSKDIARGLEYCHSNNVLHLDIKPKNILLCDSTCKICDFGNSINILDRKPYKHRGTIAYTAPEILKGLEPTQKCDIYSLGLLIWQLLSRKNPYDNLDHEVIIYKVVKFNFRPSIDFEKQDLAILCEKCWAEEPKSRPNAEEVCNILENC